MNNQSYQDELDRYFQVVNHEKVPEHLVFKGNLSKARAKLKHQTFIELNNHLVHRFYDCFQR